MNIPIQHVGRLRLPRLDKSFASGGGAKWKGRREGMLCLHVRGHVVGIQVGFECVELDHAQREEFARLFSDATRQADACEAPEVADSP